MQHEALCTCIADVTQNVFQTMVFLSPVMKDVQGGNAAQILPRDIVSKVEFSGTAVGTFTLHFRTDLALKVTSNMLQTNVNEVNGDVQDAIKEICNMIAGGIKTRLAQRGINVEYSLPVVEQSEKDAGKTGALVFSFDVDGHPFHISMTGH